MSGSTTNIAVFTQIEEMLTVMVTSTIRVCFNRPIDIINQIYTKDDISDHDYVLGSLDIYSFDKDSL